MKFKLENHPEGVMICHFLEKVEKRYAPELAKGIEKALANGKTRIILIFSQKAAEKESVSYIEKTLRQFQLLARKMGGDILFVLPLSLVTQLPNAVETLETAISRILRKDDYSRLDREVLIQELKKRKDRIAELEAENVILAEKLKDFLEIVTKPNTASEVAEGLEFYRALAGKIELLPPLEKSKK